MAVNDSGGGGAGGVRCYYELLEVDRQATEDELKKAYRRLALRWHPDKNPDRIEEATAHFRLVQKAYETLTDPQERAWYDKHRERILKGGLGRGDAYKEERLDVFRFFTSSCYDDYDDGPEGYFTVYAKLFADLADEETRACQDSDEPPPEFPEFGNSESDYDSVVGPFYSHWETFFTRKSYVWVEQHDTREAPNKFVRKAMEKENRAARDAARRERNEEVRTLVDFVKKRDPRVRAQRRRLEARAREVEVKAREMAAAARRAHRDAVGSYQAPEWARMDDMEAELAKLETVHGALDSSSSDDENDDLDAAAASAEKNGVGGSEEVEDPLSGLVCVACEKLFRTQGAKLSHDRSKRHRDRVERLRAELAGHDEAPAAAAVDDSSDGAEDENGEMEAAASATLGGRKSKKSKKKKRQAQKAQGSSDQDDDAEMQDAAEVAAPASASDGQIGGKKAAVRNDEKEEAEELEGEGEEGGGGSSKKPRRRKDRQRQKQQELLEQRKEEAAADGGGAQVCKSCRQWFDSKNLLFKHLKESGHAAAKPGGGAAAATAASAAAAATRTEGKKSSGKRR